MEKEKKVYKNGSKMGDRKPGRGKKSNNEKRSSSSSSSSTSSFSSEEETDIRDLKPIRGYLMNRRELARQLFKSVKSDKIRMMLPQILKNMNFSDLEEWCASELCGMSETRITCIINGQPMLDSSDTSETDDSGPSLEIISDTEEWLSDGDVPIKEEPSSSGVTKTKRSKILKSKMKAHGRKKNDRDKLRAKARGDNTTVAVEPDVRVKKEKEKVSRPVSTNKEGESLLDLLELEMRARAIRALIRKEEDVIPTAASEKRMALTTNALRDTLNSAVSASLSNENSSNGKFNVDGTTEKNENPVEKLTRGGKTTETGEDEDVVFVVVKPTPTIELLSSESENEKERKENEKKTENKIVVEDETVQTSMKTTNHRLNKDDPISEIRNANSDNATNATTNERIVTIDKSSDGTDSLKIVITKRVSESANSPSPSKSSKTKKNLTEKGDKHVTKIETDQVLEKNVTEKPSHDGKGLFKKIKRKQHLRTKRKALEDTERDQANEVLENSLSTSSVNDADADSNKIDVASPLTTLAVAAVKLEIVEKEESRPDVGRQKNDEKRANDLRKVMQPRIPSDDDRLDDFEEIIDLDDYPDDMYEMEGIDDSGNTEKEDTVNDKQNRPVEVERKTPLIVDDTIIPNISDSSETWASRYYQTDDVQNVIKESKIQSEIRKRLRERQRLSKLNGSPKSNSPGDSTMIVEKNDDKVEPKPTGSVQEYLALKNSITASILDDPDKVDTEVEKKKEDSDVATVVTKNSTSSGSPESSSVSDVPQTQSNPIDESSLERIPVESALKVG